MPNRPSKKARRYHQKQDEILQQQLDRRSELVYRKLRGDILSEEELLELEDLTRIVKGYLVRPVPMDEETRRAMEEVREWIRQHGKAPID